MNQLSNTQQKSVSKFFDKQLLTISQVSTWMQVSEKTIRDWIYKRKIPFIKVGRLVRFDKTETARWISQGASDAYSEN